MSDLRSTLFVGNLSVFCTEVDIEQLFSTYGLILEIRMAKSEDRSKHLSYGFVKFASVASAQLAMHELNGALLCGRPLKMGKAFSRSNKKMLGISMPNEPEYSTASVHVTFISHQLYRVVNEESLRHLFSQFGPVVDAVICKSNIDQSQTRQSGYGFIHFPGTPNGIDASFRAAETLVDVMIDEVNYKCKISHHLEKHLKPEPVIPQVPSNVNNNMLGGMASSLSSSTDDMMFESSFTNGLNDNMHLNNYAKNLPIPPPLSIAQSLDMHAPSLENFEQRSRGSSSLSSTTMSPNISPNISPSVPTRNISVQIPSNKISPRMFNPPFPHHMEMQSMKMNNGGYPHPMNGYEPRGKVSPTYYHGSRQTLTSSFGSQQINALQQALHISQANNGPNGGGNINPQHYMAPPNNMNYYNGNAAPPSKYGRNGGMDNVHENFHSSLHYQQQQQQHESYGKYNNGSNNNLFENGSLSSGSISMPSSSNSSFYNSPSMSNRDLISPPNMSMSRQQQQMLATDNGNNYLGRQSSASNNNGGFSNHAFSNFSSGVPNPSSNASVGSSSSSFASFLAPNGDTNNSSTGLLLGNTNNNSNHTLSGSHNFTHDINSLLDNTGSL